MKKAYKIVLPGALIVMIALGLLYLNNRQKSQSNAPRINIPLVKMSHPQRATVTRSLQFTGDVLPYSQAGIFSKVGGTLEQMFVDMGTPVHQGQLLALIDTTELYQQAQQAAATCQNTKSIFDRARELFDRKLASQQDRDNAAAAAEIAAANFKLASTRLAYARITAPFSGTITRRFLDPGALVAAGTSTLFTLMDQERVKVIINVLEKDIPLVAPGKTATVTVDAYPGREFNGEITRLSQAVDIGTRTMAVEVDVPNADRTLKPGMFAKVLFVVERHEEALTLPLTAILKDDQGAFVFTASSAVAQKVRLKTGIEQDSTVEIVSGLADTSITVITTGQQFVKDGGAIKIQP
jgi:RND family efflux transporter MFP subunit